MRTTRVLSLTLATAALVAGGTAGAALADEGGGFTICFDGVTRSFGPGYRLESFLADGAAEGACAETGTEEVPELPVPVASTVGQVLDPRTPDPGSTTEVPEPVVPTTVPEGALPTAVPEPSAVAVDVPPALTTTGQLTESEPPLVTPDPGSAVPVPTHGGGGAATLPTDRLPEVRTAARTSAGAPASPTSVVPSPATTSQAAPSVRARHTAAPAAAPAEHLATTGTPALPLLVLALATTAAGLVLRAAARVRRAAR